MARQISIFQPEGADPHTTRVELSTAQTHVTANDQLAEESRLLLEFAADEGEETPVDLLDGLFYLSRTESRSWGFIAIYERES